MTEIAPINKPQITLSFTLGLSTPPVAILATMCVVESALVTIKIKIKAMARILVISEIGNCFNNSNNATE